MYKIEISDKSIEDAIKRSEEKFEEELKGVDIRAVVLKTKKALLEQTLKNNQTYNLASDHEHSIRNLNRSSEYYQHKIENLEKEMKAMKDVFVKSIALMEGNKKKKTKGFFRNFWEFIKCLMR